MGTEIAKYLEKPCPDQTLRELHLKFRTEGEDLVMNLSLGDLKESYVSKFILLIEVMDQNNTVIGGHFFNFITKNKAIALQHCKEGWQNKLNSFTEFEKDILKKYSAHIQNKTPQEIKQEKTTTINEIKNKWSKLKEEFEGEFKQNSVFSEILENSQSQFDQIIARISQHLQLGEEEQKVIRMGEEVQELERKRLEDQKKIEEQQIVFEAERLEQQKRIAKMEESLLKEQEEHQRQMEQARLDLEEKLKTATENQRKELLAQKKEYEKRLATETQQLKEQIQQQRVESEKRITQLQQENDRKIDQIRRESEENQRKMKKELEQKTKELEEKSASMNEGGGSSVVPVLVVDPFGRPIGYHLVCT